MGARGQRLERVGIGSEGGRQRVGLGPRALGVVRCVCGVCTHTRGWTHPNAARGLRKSKRCTPLRWTRGRGAGGGQVAQGVPHTSAQVRCVRVQPHTPCRGGEIKSQIGGGAQIPMRRTKNSVGVVGAQVRACVFVCDTTPGVVLVEFVVFLRKRGPRQAPAPPSKKQCGGSTKTRAATNGLPCSATHQSWMWENTRAACLLVFVCNPVVDASSLFSLAPSSPTRCGTRCPTETARPV